MRARIVLVFALVVAGGAVAQQVRSEQTPGMLATVAVPTDWQVEYDPFGDSTVMLEPNRNQVVLFGWYAMDPAAALQNLLAELGGQAYFSAIRPARFGGLSGAEVQIDGGTGTKDWFLALNRDGALLGVWAKTAGTFDALSPVLTSIVSGTAVAPASLPPLVSGQYQISSEYSGGVSGSILAERYVTLHPDGSATSNSAIMGGTEGVDVMGQGRQGGARWEVRGDRLLIVTAEGDLINKRLAGVYNNGLSFYGAGRHDNQEHWVRQ